MLRRRLLLFWLGAVYALMPSHASATMASSAQTGSLTVAWVAEGDLFTWNSRDPQARRIASEVMFQPYLSADGAQVVYVRGPDYDPRELWIGDTAGTTERLLFDGSMLLPDDPTRRPWQIVWAADQIYFNTVTGEQIGTRTADDLWRVDPVSGVVERLLPDGEGGRIFPAPDGSRLAVVSAGEYTQPGETPRAAGTVAFYDLTTGERTIALEFTAAATGSQWRWYPDLHWLPDSSGLLTAIPDPDLVYGTGETVLWRLPVTGAPVQIGTVDADFFGLPVFSNDGKWMAYIARRKSPSQTTITLMVGAPDGGDAAAYAEGEIGSLSMASWLPAESRFIYAQGAPGELWLGGPRISPERFPADDVPVGEIVWADEAEFVLSTMVVGAPALKWGTLDDPSALQAIAEMETAPFFDAVSH